MFDILLRSVVLSLAAAGVSASAASPPLNAQQQLGKQLFFDTRLSHGSNQACASCHSPSAGFADPNHNRPNSPGSDPALSGKRNAPSAAYMAFSPDFHYDADGETYVGGQFYDGRATSLEEQAKQPLVGAVEMGNPDKASVVAKLQASPNAAAFISVFGAGAFDNTDAAFDNIAGAIAAYERSSEVSPFSSKFDAYLRGERHLSPQELRGMAAFNDPMKGNCSACHLSTASPDGTPPLFTDFTYDNIGVPKNYDSPFLSLGAPFNPDGADFIDLGLGGRLGDPDLYGVFKVTTLRNIAVTAPYTHNGYFTTLDQVVDFYATRDVKPVCEDASVTAAASEMLGCWAPSEVPGTVNHDELGNLPLTAGDKADIVAFLRTLTDGYVVTGIPEPATWTMMIAGFAGAGVVLRRRRLALTAD